jgi:hypothetical protein
MAVRVLVRLPEGDETAGAFQRIDAASVLEVVANMKLATLDVPTRRVPRLVDLHPYQVDEHLLHQILLQFTIPSEFSGDPTQLPNNLTFSCHR